MPGFAHFCELQRKTSAFFPAEHKRKQRFFTDGGEAAGLCGFFRFLIKRKKRGITKKKKRFAISLRSTRLLEIVRNA